MAGGGAVVLDVMVLCHHLRIKVVSNENDRTLYGLWTVEYRHWARAGCDIVSVRGVTPVQ